jgi:hypothetical protein
LVAPVAHLDEHDSVAKVGVAGHDATANLDRNRVEPESGMNPKAYWQRVRKPQVASIPAEIGRFGAEGRIKALDLQFNGYLDRPARIMAALRPE